MDTSLLSTESGITRRFRDFGSDVQVEQDEYGFVEPSFGSLGIRELLSTASAILIRGRPWMGKTYLAKKVKEQATELDLGKYVWHSSLEQHTIGCRLEPGEWAEWCNGQDRACWILDAIDEAELIETNVSARIAHLLEGLNEEARGRLKLIMFGRETEIPSPFTDSLRTLYQDDFRDVELMPLDRDNARRMVPEQTFAAVLSVIQDKRLQGVCNVPAALAYITQHKNDAELSEDIVWKGILESLLQEKSSTQGRRKQPRSEVDQLFLAAARIAVVLTFSDYERLGNDHSPPQALSVGQLFKSDSRPGEPTVIAAREAIQTEMFSRHGFAQKNIREWMCAFGLKECSLGRLRVLLTDKDDKLCREHWAVISLLTKIGRPEVRDWIRDKNGGVPPLSDLSTLTLAEVKDIVDRLEAIADTTPWEVSLWGDRGLKRLNVAGVGKMLAERLRDPSRSTNKRSLLVQIALETSAREALPVARAIVENVKDDDKLRYSALVLMLRLATPQEFQALESFVRRAHPNTIDQKKIVSAIIRRYLDDGFWDVEQAAHYASEPDGDVIDSTAVLAHVLQEKMTVAAARVFIRRSLRRLKSRRPTKVTRRPRGEHRHNDLLVRAAECLLAQEPPN